MKPANDAASRVHPSLLDDMRLALLAELGARSIYGQLAPRLIDPEFGAVIARFHDEENEIVTTLRALMFDLGARSVPAKSRRRALLAWALARTSRGRGSSLALRLCHESELTRARWYAEYACYLAQVGAVAHARTCDELAQSKLRHAGILAAWVPR